MAFELMFHGFIATTTTAVTSSVLGVEAGGLVGAKTVDPELLAGVSDAAEERDAIVGSRSTAAAFGSGFVKRRWDTLQWEHDEVAPA